MIHASPIPLNCEPQNDRPRAGGGIVLSVTQGLHLTVYIALIRFAAGVLLLLVRAIAVESESRLPLLKNGRIISRS